MQTWEHKLRLWNKDDTQKAEKSPCMIKKWIFKTNSSTSYEGHHHIVRSNVKDMKVIYLDEHEHGRH